MVCETYKSGSQQTMHEKMYVWRMLVVAEANIIIILVFLASCHHLILIIVLRCVCVHSE